MPAPSLLGKVGTVEAVIPGAVLWLHTEEEAMAITEADKQRIIAALDRSRLATIDDDEATQQQGLLHALATEAGELPPSQVAPILREYIKQLSVEMMQTNRVLQAMDAIMQEVQHDRVATPYDLMAKRGIANLPELLGSLGFTGDLNGLADEIEAAIVATT